jgi:hypothetical protein
MQHTEDTWQTGAIADAPGFSRQQHLRVNILTASSPDHASPQPPSASSAVDETSESADDDAADLDTHSLLKYCPPQVPYSQRRPHPESAVVPNFIEALDYNDTLECLLPDVNHSWYVVIMRPALYSNKDVTPDLFVLSIFGWLTRGPLRHLSTARPDSASGAPGLLFLLYIIGKDNA